MTKRLIDDLTLIAHRGYPTAFPENTLLGFQQSVNHGATHVEVDIQCTRDGVPVLYHDDSTRRLSGHKGTITGRTLSELETLSASYPKRFGDQFSETPIATLKDFARWLKQHPSLTAFVEIKKQSLRRFGIEPVVAWVMEALKGVNERCVVISFDDGCVEHTADRYDVPTGWVLPKWSSKVESRARQLSPEYLFAEDVMVPRNTADIWRGSWQWAVYVVDDLQEALSYVERGIRLVETDAIGYMLDQYRAGNPQSG